MPHFVLVVVHCGQAWLWLVCALLNETCLKQGSNIAVCSKGGEFDITSPQTEGWSKVSDSEYKDF